MNPRPKPEGAPAGTASPLRNALLAQLAGLLVVVAVVAVRQEASPALSLAAVQGVCAMAAAAWLRMPRWWWWISLGFAPLAVLAQGLGLPPWAWLAGFVLLLLVFWRTDASRVPLYMSNAATAQALAGLLPPGACRVIDLGCGDGRLLRQLARARPDSQFLGLEHAPLTWAWAWLMSRGLPQLRIGYGSFWGHDLAGYDLVYAFLSPVPMPRLWDKACAELQPGALLVSNSFAVLDQRPLRQVQVDDSRQTCLHVYRPGAHPPT